MPVDPLTRYLLMAFSERDVLSVRALGRCLVLSLTNRPKELVRSRISSSCILFACTSGLKNDKIMRICEFENKKELKSIACFCISHIVSALLPDCTIKYSHSITKAEFNLGMLLLLGSSF